ncbi:MAG: phosphotransferase [Porticoccaceae bacterium]|nr:phosphotransferase [Porticoccaceae bacterium]
MMNEFPEQSLARALDSWPQWNLSLANKPRVVKALSGGLTNRNYLLNGNLRDEDLRDKDLLETETCLLVMRVNSPESQLLGIDRERERLVLGSLAGQCALGKGLVPKIIYCNSDDGLLVTEYIEGRHWRVEELKDPRELKKLLRVFKQVGEIRGDFPEFDYRAHVEHYWRGLHSAGSKNKNLTTCFQQAKIAVEQLSEINRDKPRVLCHHDLSPLNVIETLRGELVLLDWEYAGGGWPVMDYVALIRNWQLYKSQALILNTLNNNNGVEFANVDFTTAEVKAAQQVWEFIDRAWYSLNTPAE